MMSVGASAAAAAAIAQATKASGVIVRLEPRDFLSVLDRHEEPLVIRATGGFFTTQYEYLTSYRGLAFYTKNATPLVLPRQCEVIDARKIWIPG
jgi:hypothetical protein